MNRRDPAQINRGKRRENFRYAFQKSLSDNDVTQKEAADRAGMRPNTMQRICDREAKETLQVPDAPALDRGVAYDVVQWQAERIDGRPKYSLTELPEYDFPHDPYTYLATAILETSEACAALAETLSPSIGWSPSRADRVEKEANEGIAALLAVRELARKHKVNVGGGE